MSKAFTVGELRKSLDNIPDNLKVRLSSDTGVDQGQGSIIIEDAYRVKYELPEGEHYEDGSTVIDYFTIYANHIDDDKD